VGEKGAFIAASRFGRIRKKGSATNAFRAGGAAPDSKNGLGERRLAKFSGSREQPLPIKSGMQGSRRNFLLKKSLQRMLCKRPP